MFGAAMRALSRAIKICGIIGYFFDRQYLRVEALVALRARHVPIFVNQIDERGHPEFGPHAAAKKTAGQLGKGNPRRRKARRRIHWLIRSHCGHHI